jgi:acetylornithine/succinyldiaminopimelate/putrescine aminotransferase/predicted amino acid dehydrogenase
MTIAALLADLRQRGVELWAEGGQLRYSAPKGTLTPAVRSKLVEQKVEVLAWLRSNGDGERSDATYASPSPTSDRSPPARRTAIFNSADLAGSPPYLRHVNPYLGSWLARLDLDKQFVRGEGCYLYDTLGKRYLDFIAQYGAVPFGYNPPEIWDGIEKARNKQLPSFVQPSILTSAGELAERLIQVAPPGLRYVSFANSGAEAIEGAIKLCRSASGRRGILAARRSFHGKTLGAMSATGSAFYQEPFGGPAENFYHVPFGDVEALSRALAERKGYYAAFIVEPIQGEGGIVEAPPRYLSQARDLCRNAGTLFVIDEVQTGLGRTGSLFACDHEAVAPDVITLAKALGGGLMPIGACLCKEEIYTEEFAIRHSSTFAGNALACQAALATLDFLEKDNRALVRQVAMNGETLKNELLKLQHRYPDIIRAVRGRGYMLGIEFDPDSSALRRGLLGYLGEQKLLSYLIASYLLNVQKVRVAPTASAEGVLRIEPPLIAQWNQCRTCLDALEQTLYVLASGDTARLLAHLVEQDAAGPLVLDARPSARPDRKTRSLAPKASANHGRFAFLVHLTSPNDFANLDPTLKVFSEEQLAQLMQRGAGLLVPSCLSEFVIQSQTGQEAYGEFIAVPYTARELMQMPREQGLSEIAQGVEFAMARGAQIVGLGGFTSVATLGGLALNDLGLGPLTTGNSYTVASAWRGVQLAASRRNRQLSGSCVAVVGATGAVGRATSLLISSDVARLILTGNPAHPERSLVRLRQVAASVAEHLWKLHVDKAHTYSPGTLGDAVLAMTGKLAARPTSSDFVKLAEEMVSRPGQLSITTDLCSCLPAADVVITATSAVEAFFKADYLKRDAIVCEMSRPFNVTPDVRAARPDVLFVQGGLVRAPCEPDLGWEVGHGQGIVFACMAETMLLALEQRYHDTSLGADLDLGQIYEFAALGDKHGFLIELFAD